jgi:hypothetical protein
MNTYEKSGEGRSVTLTRNKSHQSLPPWPIGFLVPTKCVTLTPAQAPISQQMDPHSVVIVSLHTPKEKIWGELLAISTAGVTIRGIDLNSFDHFIRQINEPETERVGVPTVFFPMTRIERIALDEPAGSIPSMDELFMRKIGRSLIEYLAQFA